jgi:hypothetical protein
MPTELDTLSTEFTSASDCRFYRNKNGFLCLELAGEDQGRVQLRRALPFAAPEEYISITDLECKEIAMLASLALFASKQRALLEDELDSHYFYPVVTQLKSIKEKMGSYYIDLRVGDYEKTIAVKDVSRSLRQLGGGRLIITDVDGNRFLIPDVYAVQRKSLRMLEPYLY